MQQKVAEIRRMELENEKMELEILKIRKELQEHY